MPETTLPDFFNFGANPASTIVEPPFDPDFEPDELEVAAEEINDFGVDISLNTSTLMTSTSLSGDLIVKTEGWSLYQWVVMALLTPRGQDILYGEGFGSELHTVIGGSLPQDAIVAEVPKKIKEALLVHDRIQDVQDFRFDKTDDGILTVGFRIITDDDDSLLFEGLNLG